MIRERWRESEGERRVGGKRDKERRGREREMERECVFFGGVIERGNKKETH